MNMTWVFGDEVTELDFSVAYTFIIVTKCKNSLLIS